MKQHYIAAQVQLACSAGQPLAARGQLPGCIMSRNYQLLTPVMLFHTVPPCATVLVLRQRSLSL
jgi:hypothetical protein